MGFIGKQKLLLTLALVNVYNPNEDDLNFFKTLAEHIEDFQKDKILIGGNFNLVLDRQ